MARESSPVEFNSFIGGLVTDSSPLNSDPNTAVDIDNFTLNLDGSVTRRKGLNKVLQDTGGANSSEYIAMRSVLGYGAIGNYLNTYRPKLKAFIWGGANGSDTILTFCNPLQSDLSFYKVEADKLVQLPITGGSQGIYRLPTNVFDPVTSRNKSVAFTVNGSKLFAVNGTKTVTVFSFDGTNVVKEKTGTISVRDTWGVNDIDLQGNDLNGESISLRPIINGNTYPEVYTRHLYNLMNQGWVDPILNVGGATECAVTEFLRFYSSVFGVNGVMPSNSDILTDYMYPNTSNTADATVDRYHAKDHVRETTTSTPAPRGRFVIDLMDRYTTRNARRLEGVRVWSEKGVALFPYLSAADMYDTDFNSFGGPSTLASFAGRVWYSGISNAGITNDWDGAPDLSKLVLFSQLADSDSASFRCYQAGDPTSKDSSDIVATDGGYIVIPEAETILRLEPYESGLVVFATNGVWMISGTESSGFTATGYRVVKISNAGCGAVDSVVSTPSGLLYLSQQGLQLISGTEVDGFTSTVVTTGKISNWILGLSSLSRGTFVGGYDAENNICTWNYLGETKAYELRLDLNLNAYYVHSWEGSIYGGEVLPIMTLGLPKALTTTSDVEVTVGGVGVVVSGELVAASTARIGTAPTSVIKVIQQLNNIDGPGVPALVYGFAVPSTSSFNDWTNFPVGNPTGSLVVWDIPNPTDSPGTIVTGALTGGDTQRYKTAPMMTMLFNKTEDGFYTDELGDIRPSNESSCKVQAQWEWANSANSCGS
jgi:hypothetical protein